MVRKNAVKPKKNVAKTGSPFRRKAKKGKGTSGIEPR
jgi:hypothetical protein